MMLGFLKRLSFFSDEQLAPVDDWSERFWEFVVRPLVLRWKVCHIAGPETVDYAPDELIAICVVRNGASHIRQFVEHHFELGVRHIVFLDNNSSDDTVRIAASYSNVTVLQTNCPYRFYENVMKRYLVKRFAKKRWSLCVDIDERFEYPCANVLSIRSFLAYLNEHSYTAVVAQMLDLFADNPVDESQWGPDQPVEDVCNYYDISNIEKTHYKWGILSNEKVDMHFGGIRRTLFGTRNGLTKAAMVFLDGQVLPFVEWHHALHARIADISCLLRHYPFAGSFYEKVLDAVETGRYGSFTTLEYQNYWQILKQNPALGKKRETGRKLECVDALVNEGFLVVSEAYQQ